MHLARTKAAGSKVRASMTGGAGTDTLDLRVLYGVLADYQRGNFTVRMPDDRTGLAGKICDALNTTIERNERLVKELERLSTVVGKAGNVERRAAAVGGRRVEHRDHPINALMATSCSPRPKWRA